MANGGAGQKVCRDCKTEFPLDMFYFSRGYYSSYCKTCHCKRAAERRSRRVAELDAQVKRDRYRREDLARRYGISVEQYEAMLDEQGGVCAICKRPETEKFKDRVKTLAVDHCHVTGTIRGLLCSACNLGIGRLNDSIELLQAAVLYLATHSQRSTDSSVSNRGTLEIG